MKNKWKKVSTVLMILAASLSLKAATPDNPGEKKPKANASVLTVKGEMVFVNHLNLEGEKVTLKVYDEESRLLYLKSFDQTPVVEKAFNFENAYEGTYSVVLNDGDESYTATVAVAL